MLVIVDIYVLLSRHSLRDFAFVVDSNISENQILQQSESKEEIIMVYKKVSF